tara:strand:- start:790 stop:1044 length:255 start_codon:yes stop_codon:yes gene_type:complete
VGVEALVAYMEAKLASEALPVVLAFALLPGLLLLLLPSCLVRTVTVVADTVQLSQVVQGSIGLYYPDHHQKVLASVVHDYTPVD